MRKQTIALFFFQLLASTIVMMAEANTSGFDLAKSNNETAEVTDLELQANQEKDVFPDLISFAMHIYQ